MELGMKQKRSRRAVVMAGAALATVPMPGIANALPRPMALAYPATPLASPGAAQGYGRPLLLVEAGALAAGRVVALTPAKDFAASHLPTAAQIDWPALEVTDTSDESIAQWTHSMRTTLASLGVGGEAIVTYDGGTLFAARLWWVIHFLGLPDALMLDGGLPAWIADGGKIAKDGGTAEITPVSTAAVPSVRRESLATLRDVEADIGKSDIVLIDARTKDEYAAGHIPGAVNLSYPLNATGASPHRWKPASDLRAMYAAIGVTPEKTIVPYCSTGVRSAVTFFTLWLLGFDKVALYTGSWAEWGKDPTTPKRSGMNP